MNERKRDIILLVKDTMFNPAVLDREVRHIHEMVGDIETDDNFCRTHELLQRNRITSKRGKIIKALQEKELKPFWFFMNKN